MRLRKEIGDIYTVDEALLIMRNLKCKVFEQELLVQELTKRQRVIVARLGIIVPKKMGI